MDNRISREEIIKIYNVELSFFNELVDYGLLNTVSEESVTYILQDDLRNFEKMANFYYDLDINVPGLDVINNLLEKIKELQQENQKLMNHLFLVSGDWDDVSE